MDAVEEWMAIYRGFQDGDLTVRQVWGRKAALSRRLNAERREKVLVLQRATPRCRCRSLLSLARWIYDIPVRSRYALVHREIVASATCFRDLADLGGTRCRSGFWVRIRPPFGHWEHCLPAGYWQGSVCIRLPGGVASAEATVRACVPSGVEVEVDDARRHGQRPMWRLVSGEFLAWLEFRKTGDGDLLMCGPYVTVEPDVLTRFCDLARVEGPWLWCGERWGRVEILA